MKIPDRNLEKKYTPVNNNMNHFKYDFSYPHSIILGLDETLCQMLHVIELRDGKHL